MTGQSRKNPADVYHHYLGPALFEPCADEVLASAAPCPGERALDLACGTGIVTAKLAAQLGQRGQVVAVDISPEMLAVARQQNLAGAAVDWREGAADQLPVEDNAVDLLICQQGLQFFPDRRRAVAEMRRVVRPGGRIVIATWKSLQHHAVFRALMEAEAAELDIPVETLSVPFSLGEVDALRELLEAPHQTAAEIREIEFTAELPDPQRFIELTVMAGAAVIPELASKSKEQREALVAAISHSIRGVVDEHRRGERVCFPMRSLVATLPV